MPTLKYNLTEDNPALTQEIANIIRDNADCLRTCAYGGCTPYAEIERLSTFDNWPKEDIVSAANLAKNGFISVHYKDHVTCVFCKITLGHWEKNDVVEHEHETYSGECPFINDRTTGNIPMCITESYLYLKRMYLNKKSKQNKNMIFPAKRESVFKERFESFQDDIQWPKEIVVSSLELARAGFTYTMYTDHVTCNHCNLGVRNWKAGDKPAEVHYRLNPSCTFIRMHYEPLEIMEEIQDAMTDISNFINASRASLYTNALQMNAMPQYTEEENQIRDFHLSLFIDNYHITTKRNMIYSRNIIKFAIWCKIFTDGWLWRDVSTYLETVMDVMDALTSNDTEFFNKWFGISNYRISKSILDEINTKKEESATSNVCSICLENEVNVLFLPCRHFIICNVCVPKLMVSTCPFCRTKIEEGVKVIRSSTN